MTIREALTNANIDSLDASILMVNSLTQRRRDAEGITRSKLYGMSNELITKDEYELFFSLVNRRLNGECVAYITGKKEFWGLEFEVNKNVLVPRPETELLVEHALKICTELTKLNRIRVLDLCTGSGAIAIALKHEMPDLEITAIDISAEALEVAKANAARLLPKNNNITFLKSDLYNDLPYSLLVHCDRSDRNRSVPYSLIISNPPYIATSEIQTLAVEVQKEPHIALDGGETGLEIIERIIKDAPNYLINGGYLLMEINSRCDYVNKVKNLLENRGFKDIIIYKDLAGLDRIIGGKHSC